VKLYWQRDLNGPLKDGFHPINGSDDEVYISRDDLLAILTFHGEIVIDTYPIAADRDGIVIHKVLGLRAPTDETDGIGPDGDDGFGKNHPHGVDGFGKKR